MSHFQVKLGGDWKDYSRDEDKILKRAFMAGFPTAKFHLRGQDYIYEFRRMVQINKDTKKERSIRAPKNWKPPSKPLVPAGPTTVINVPPGAPGTTIQVPHPKLPGAFIAVSVPASAKVGQAMLVPVPAAAVTAAGEPTQPAKSDAPASKKSKGGWSTGAKVAAGAAGVAAVGGLAVGGVVLGEHIAEHGLDATVDAVGDGLEDAGEAIGDFAVDAGEFVVDAAEDVGDFVMDLF
mmetsp:Transcript_88490/g.162152  ORF Transcript_88490/g.162152 Transcript_88490/m.162152 type:complete len:235 (+) Transcript_88490:69-773(+)